MPLLFQPKLAKPASYRPEIDGLRALAVLPVLLYHAKVAAFSGGYVGVDIFFVISGYLITTLIASDIAAGRFSFVSFYGRRIRRIFPALFAMVFACILVAAVMFAPNDFADFGRSLIAMTFFVSNIFFKYETASEKGYFDPRSDSLPLIHTWSLSVEEQFYIFFPMGFLVLARWAKGREVAGVFAIFIVSFAISSWAAHYKAHNAFYMLVPRAWELLAGSLLALKAVPPPEKQGVPEMAGVAGLGLIAWPVFAFTSETVFPGLNALFPCMGAFLILYAIENGSLLIKRLLGFRPLVFIGVISYSLYLWHWPIIALGQYFMVGHLNKMQTILAIALSLLMAFISFEWIESPFRGADSRASRQQVFYSGMAASLLSALLGVMIYTYQGLPGRYDAKTRHLIAANMSRKNMYDDVCGSWRKEYQSIDDLKSCLIDGKTPKNIMFLGDSHAQQLYPLLKKMVDNNEFQDHGVVLASSLGCPLTEHMNRTKKNYHCDEFASFALLRAEKEDIDTVFIVFSVWWASRPDEVCPWANGKCLAMISVPDQIWLVLEEIGAKIRTLKAHGKRVILSLPFPTYEQSIPNLEIHNAIFGKFGLGQTARETRLPNVRKQIEAVARTAGAEIFDPRKSLCPGGQCITQIDGVSIYKDNSHLVPLHLNLLEQNMSETLKGFK